MICIVTTESRVFVERLLAFSTGPIFSAFLGFVMTPITTWLIVPEEFGKAGMYSMALSLVSLFMYLGMDQAFVREYSAEEDKKSTLWNCFLIPFLFSVLLAIAIALMGDGISYLLFDSVEPFVIYTLSLSLPVAVLHRFGMLIIRMEEKGKLYSSVLVLNKIIELPLLVILLIVFEKSFKSIILASFLASLVVGLFVMMITKEYWFHRFSLKRDLVARMLKFGIPLVPTAIFTWVLNSMDKVALKTWADFHELGLYSVAFKIVAVLEIVRTSFATFWAPTAYRWYETNVPKERFERVGQSLTVLLILLFSIVVVFRDVVIMVFDQNYRDSAILVPFLLFIPVMYTICETTKLGINFSRKTGYNMLTIGIAGAVNFLGNFLLVPPFGSLGAAVSTGISYILYFWMNTLISRRLWYRFSLGFFHVNIFLMLALAFIAVLEVSLFLELSIMVIFLVYNRSQLFYIVGVGRDFLLAYRRTPDS